MEFSCRSPLEFKQPASNKKQMQKPCTVLLFLMICNVILPKGNIHSVQCSIRSSSAGLLWAGWYQHRAQRHAETPAWVLCCYYCICSAFHVFLILMLQNILVLLTATVGPGVQHPQRDPDACPHLSWGDGSFSAGYGSLSTHLVFLILNGWQNRYGLLFRRKHFIYIHRKRAWKPSVNLYRLRINNT